MSNIIQTSMFDIDGADPATPAAPTPVPEPATTTPDPSPHTIQPNWLTIKRGVKADCARCGGSLLPGDMCTSTDDGPLCRHCTHHIYGTWPPDFTPAKHAFEITDGMMGGDGPNRQALKGDWRERKGTPGA